MKSLFNKFAGLAVVCLGVIGVVALSACSHQAVTTPAGVTTTVESFNTSELNADAQAVIFGLGVIESEPHISAYLAKNPAKKTEFDAALQKASALASQIKAAFNGSVTLDVGKNWVKALASEVQSAVDIASAVTGVIDPSAQKYVALVQQAVPLIEALVNTFGEPAPVPATSAKSFGAPVALPQAVRERIYAGV